MRDDQLAEIERLEARVTGLREELAELKGPTSDAIDKQIEEYTRALILRKTEFDLEMVLAELNCFLAGKSLVEASAIRNKLILIIASCSNSPIENPTNYSADVNQMADDFAILLLIYEHLKTKSKEFLEKLGNKLSKEKPNQIRMKTHQYLVSRLYSKKGIHPASNWEFKRRELSKTLWELSELYGVIDDRNREIACKAEHSKLDGHNNCDSSSPAPLRENILLLAKQGYRQTQWNLANRCYDSNNRFAHLLGFYWLKRSAALDYAPAQSDIARWYSEGFMTKDFGLAAYWYRRAKNNEIFNLPQDNFTVRYHCVLAKVPADRVVLPLLHENEEAFLAELEEDHLLEEHELFSIMVRILGYLHAGQFTQLLSKRADHLSLGYLSYLLESFNFRGSNKKFEELGIALFEKAQGFLSELDEKALAEVMPKLFHDCNFYEETQYPVGTLRKILCFSAALFLLSESFSKAEESESAEYHLDTLLHYFGFNKGEERKRIRELSSDDKELLTRFLSKPTYIPFLLKKALGFENNSSIVNSNVGTFKRVSEEESIQKTNPGNEPPGPGPNGI